MVLLAIYEIKKKYHCLLYNDERKDCSPFCAVRGSTFLSSLSANVFGEQG
jgi:hypothetical protein